MVKSKIWCPNVFFGNKIVQTPAAMLLSILLYPPTLGLSGEQYFCICRSVNKYSMVQKPSFFGLFLDWKKLLGVWDVTILKLACLPHFFSLF